ncbi:MAG: hypothetical protein GY699_00925 [Desulfobacteraceae bacterium]|nr:hypothetical protein [Desulfobacteraceae bacterium]
MGALSGGIAHQFNNPISIITGHIDMIKMDYPELKRLNLYIKQMSNSTKKMNHLTSSLLAYARGGKYHEQNILISEFVLKNIEKFKHDLPLMLTMIEHINVKSCFIKADKNQLELLILSILKNAVEATQEIGVIKVFCGEEKKERIIPEKSLDKPQKGKTVLIIDDDVAVQKMIKMMLKRKGYTVPLVNMRHPLSQMPFCYVQM